MQSSRTERTIIVSVRKESDGGYICMQPVPPEVQGSLQASSRSPSELVVTALSRRRGHDAVPKASRSLQRADTSISEHRSRHRRGVAKRALPPRSGSQQTALPLSAAFLLSTLHRASVSHLEERKSPEC